MASSSQAPEMGERTQTKTSGDPHKSFYPTLGVGFPINAKLFVLTGPVGQYYATGFQPVRLLADSQYVRAFPGGVGAFKMGCNYAPTIWVGKEAAAKNCQQVLWLYGEEEEVTEVGTMNIFVYWKNEQGETELITPPLDRGVILPGVTRDSLLQLAREWGEFKVSEKSFTMHDLRKALSEGRVMEMFGAGTACVVSPVGQILYHNRQKDQYETLEIPTMKNSPNLMQRFYETIIDIQVSAT
ncbi:branched-chain-amino-acid aminotransferase 2 domain protein [Oesophagostomum dentatum]|uniref:Branched-chain-amino-acid aminotransferase n=1 Tax=Oesophagostomum dentatum TaxID=61180 RepID=A0A0B1TTH7_OESDE|nr:branched-chain-amino-acid aminotransferase 2 domain protein [Oesophagostomum dentatum]